MSLSWLLLIIRKDSKSEKQHMHSIFCCYLYRELWFCKHRQYGKRKVRKNLRNVGGTSGPAPRRRLLGWEGVTVHWHCTSHIAKNIKKVAMCSTSHGAANLAILKSAKPDSTWFRRAAVIFAQNCENKTIHVQKKFIVRRCSYGIVAKAKCVGRHGFESLWFLVWANWPFCSGSGCNQSHALWHCTFSSSRISSVAISRWHGFDS